MVAIGTKTRRPIKAQAFTAAHNKTISSMINLLYILRKKEDILWVDDYPEEHPNSQKTSHFRNVHKFFIPLRS
jgi:hypothetical protein